jgi:hypothetical protein
MFPFCPAFPVVTVIEVVPAPAVIVHPVGTVQLYVVALAIAAIEYTCPVWVAHCAVVPVIVPGCAGVAGVVAYVIVEEFALVPHELFARTR